MFLQGYCEARSNVISNSDPLGPAPREAEASPAAPIRAPRCADDLVLRPRGSRSRSRLRGCIAASSLNVECRLRCIAWIVELPCPGWLLLCGGLLDGGRAAGLVLLAGIGIVIAVVATAASPPATPATGIVTPLAGRRYGPRNGLSRRGARLPKDLGAGLVVSALLLLELALLALANLIGSGLVLWLFLLFVVDEDELLQAGDGVLLENGFGRRFPAKELHGWSEGSGEWGSACRDEEIDFLWCLAVGWGCQNERLKEGGSLRGLPYHALFLLVLRNAFGLGHGLLGGGLELRWLLVSAVGLGFPVVVVPGIWGGPVFGHCSGRYIGMELTSCKCNDT